MLRNYFVAALRNMRRYKTFTLINITGLALGMAICMVIIMSVAYQMKSDRFNPEKENIYRIITKRLDPSGPYLGHATSSLRLAETLGEHSGVKRAVRIRRGFGRHWMGIQEQQHIPVSGLYADPEILDLFAYPLVKGDVTTALTEPFTVVLTTKSAEKLFGDTDVLGKVLDMDELGEYTVTGILDMDQISTHLEFEAIASMSSAIALEGSGVIPVVLDKWEDTTSGWVYFELTDTKALPGVMAHMKEAADPNMPSDSGMEFTSQALLDIKPGPLMGNEIGPFMPWIIVYILGALGLIIMVSSCFNYVNLSVARAMSRSREVGIRKVNGAGKRQIIFQFLVESMLLSFFALGMATLMLFYFEPAFERLNFARILQWKLSHEPEAWLVIIAFTLVTGAVAGLFPSLVMSGFQPLNVLKGIKNLKLFSHVGMRKFLIVVQFTLSLFFIISILIFYNQFTMMTKAPTGFNAEEVIIAPYDEESFDVIRNTLQAQSWVESVTRSSHLPATGFVHSDGLARTIAEAQENGMTYYSVDASYLENMNISLVEGRMIRNRQKDEPESEVVLNEEAIRQLGFESPQEAIGEMLFTRDSAEVAIVGVISDYHHDALMMDIAPLALRMVPDMYTWVQVQVSKGQVEMATESITEIWKAHHPEKATVIQPLKAKVDEFYDLLFGDLVSILVLFAILATFISCLGLLGIAIYTTELRMKEVSIRKVMGAGDRNLVLTLSWGFVKLVLIATLIAIPLSYFANQMWLEMMATRISMSPWFFLAGTLLLLATALFTIGSQTLRSLRVNPAELLRNE